VSTFYFMFCYLQMLILFLVVSFSTFSIPVLADTTSDGGAESR
jgi:hypothetical protein